MENKQDTIIERAEAGLCPICKKSLPEEVVIVEYKGRDISICEKHTKKE